MKSSEVEQTIVSAFKGVHLGSGCSLCQAEEADHWGRLAAAELSAFPDADIADNWAAVSVETLDQYPYLAHMDAEGFRYYVPAFMLSILACYERSSMRVICTLSALYPKRNDRWDYHLNLYSLLSREQNAAIARYLHSLPMLVELDPEDQKVCDRALRNHWHEFL